MIRSASVLLLLLAALPAAAQSPDAARLAAAVEALRRSEARSPFGGPLFPRDMAIERLRFQSGAAELRLSGSWAGSLPAEQQEVLDELRLETFLGALAAFEVQGGVQVLVREPGGLRSLGVRERPLPKLAPPRRPPPAPLSSPRLPLGGALLGKRIAISAGHGWLENSSGWGTQRSEWKFTGCGSCRGIVEDFYNADVVSYHLIPLLENMGAEVVLVREPDHSTEPAALVDDGDADAYSETGTWADGNNPGGWAGGYRTNAPGAQGTASFALDFARPGLRRVAVRYLEGSNRTPSAAVEVQHAGGATFFDLDQRRTGTFFMDLGSFWFVPGQGSVGLSNAGDGYLIADAVKAGGGVFADSGKPWWQMAAKSYVPWAQAPDAVNAYGDVTIRPAYASHLGADAYLSFHGNASGQTGGSAVNGVSTYRYSCRPSSSSTEGYADYTLSDSAVNCDQPAGSRSLIDKVQAGMVARLRGQWDPNFGDRKKLVANFGELRVLDGVPGVLVESAFFDNLASPSGSPPPRMSDNQAMHDPRFREAIAIGIADGLAAFLSPGTKAPPGRPEGLKAINRPDGSLEVSWSAVPGASAYVLYTLTGPTVGAGRERAFDAGRKVTGTSTVLSDLVPRQLYAFRVAAADSNGVGFPSQVVAARFRGARNLTRPAAEALLVGAYDRRDAWAQEIDNDFGYAVEHGQALAGAPGADVFFDGALDERIEDGSVALAGYRLVDFAAGKDSVAHESVSSAMQGLLATYVGGGGALLISGEEVGYDLSEKGSTEDQAFVRDVLHADYVSDDADAYKIGSAAGGPFEGFGEADVDDGTLGTYEVKFPDVLAARAGESVVAMTYSTGGASAISSARTLFFGVPLETVHPASARAGIFGLAVRHLAPGIAAGDLDLDGAPDECEQKYGLDWRDAADGAGDADNDGKSNAQECQEGTDPFGNVARPDAGQPDAMAPDAAGTDAGPDAGRDAGRPDASRPDTGAGLDAALIEADAGEEPPDAAQPIAEAGVYELHGSGCSCSEPGSVLPLVGLVLGVAFLPRRKTR